MLEVVSAMVVAVCWFVRYHIFDCSCKSIDERAMCCKYNMFYGSACKIVLTSPFHSSQSSDAIAFGLPSLFNTYFNTIAAEFVFY